MRALKFGLGFAVGLVIAPLVLATFYFGLRAMGVRTLPDRTGHMTYELAGADPTRAGASGSTLVEPGSEHVQLCIDGCDDIRFETRHRATADLVRVFDGSKDCLVCSRRKTGEAAHWNERWSVKGAPLKI